MINNTHSTICITIYDRYLATSIFLFVPCLPSLAGWHAMPFLFFYLLSSSPKNAELITRPTWRCKHHLPAAFVCSLRQLDFNCTKFISKPQLYLHAWHIHVHTYMYVYIQTCMCKHICTNIMSGFEGLLGSLLSDKCVWISVCNFKFGWKNK